MTDINKLDSLIKQHQKRLYILRERAAKYGSLNTPPEILMEIQEIKDIIEDITKEKSDFLKSHKNNNEAEILFNLAIESFEKIKNLENEKYYIINDPIKKINFHEINNSNNLNDVNDYLENLETLESEIIELIDDSEILIRKSIEKGCINADIFITLGEILEKKSEYNSVSIITLLECFITAAHINNKSIIALTKIMDICEILRQENNWKKEYSEELYSKYKILLKRLEREKIKSIINEI